jgi:hypothetical protein
VKEERIPPLLYVSKPTSEFIDREDIALEPPERVKRPRFHFKYLEGDVTSFLTYERLQASRYQVITLEERREIPTINEKIKTIISEVEREPRLLFSKDLLEELKGYVKVSREEVENIRHTLDALLDEFARKKFGVPMEEKTKKFIKNELVYLILKLREEKT